jgi:L-fuconolactonase
MNGIDAHVHLWDLDVRPQPWTAPFPVLQRSFGVSDLKAVLAGSGVEAAIVVQASDSFAETLDLLSLAANESCIAGVVGWVDLTANDVAGQLAALRAAPGGAHLVGVRHQLQVEPDPNWLARASVRAGLAAVAAAGLAYDIVVSPDQLGLVIDTVRRVPQLRFVLDHAGKPPIASGDIGQWRQDMTRLASVDNVAVKLSGLVTEANWQQWSQPDLDPVIEHVLELFGPQRTMLGSDWPVCLLAAEYRRVLDSLDAGLGGIAHLSAQDRAAVQGATAKCWYLAC